MFFRKLNWNVVGWFKIVSAISYTIIAAGVIKVVKVKPNDRGSEGSVILVVEAAAAPAAKPAAPAPAAAAVPAARRRRRVPARRPARLWRKRSRSGGSDRPCPRIAA